MSKEYYLQTIRHNLKNNLFSLIIYMIFFTVLTVLSSFVWFDYEAVLLKYGSLENMSSYDYDLLNKLNIQGIGGSGYIFTYIFLTIIAIIFIFVEAYISYKKDSKNVCLLLVKGIKRKDSNYLYLLIKSLLFLISLLLGLLISLIILAIINNAFNTKIPFLTINNGFWIGFLLMLIPYLLVNLFAYTHPYKEQNIIQTIRTFY